MRLGRLAQAQVMYERVLELAGGAGEIWSALAMCWRRSEL
jgi:hypothetical protein